jgi:D-tyrosyl-tRNA(Tyr) deacylase
MRVLIQRVQTAKVELDDNTLSGQINKGLLILLGIETEDGQEDIEYLVHKILQLRVFDDEKGVMNLCISDIKGEILIVSQFTLHASTKKGNRPSYIRAARPEVAIPLYESFLNQIKLSNLKVETGVFGAMMQVHLINDGPVTIWIDSKNKEY